MSLFHLLTGAAALAFTATIAQAADMPVKAPRAIPVVEQASGYVEVYGGWASTRLTDTFCDPGCGTETSRQNGWVLGGAGRGNYWLAPNISTQLDAQGEGTSYKAGSPGNTFQTSAHSYLLAGHLNWRDSQRGLLGAFVAAGDKTDPFTESARRHGMIGGEAQLYWNQFTLYVQGGFDTTLGTHSLEPSAWFIRGTGRYFIMPNTKIEGTVLYANGDLDYGSSCCAAPSRTFNIWLWEAKLEHRFATTPFSAFIKYRGWQTKFNTLVVEDFSVSTKATDNRVLVGLNLYMGQDTLIANDRRGATLDVIDLPFTAPLSVAIAQ